MSIQVKVSDIILQPFSLVYKSVIEPEKITKYFVSNSSGKLIEGAKIEWEFKDYNVIIKVNVIEIIENEKIMFNWEVSGKKSQVTMLFFSKDKNKTKMEIREDSFEENEEGIAKAMQQTQGWTDFICSLKAFLYTGINLRSGKMN
tara:strand:- start:19631 stop:20065 length:435 start_codon:yes stop_codon:yes gene_type:complete